MWNECNLYFSPTPSPTLDKDIQNALAAVGYPMIKQPSEELSENSKQSKHKLCSPFDRSKDRGEGEEKMITLTA